VNIAFSHAGLAKLLEHSRARLAELDQFEDEAFRAGLPARSLLLGDPADPKSPGNPKNWLIGAPGKEPDMLLVCAADQREQLTAVVDQLREGAKDGGFEILWEDLGDRLPHGIEHFGFKDGV